MRAEARVAVVLIASIGAGACGGDRSAADGDAGGGGTDAAGVVCGEAGEIVTLPYEGASLAGCTWVRGGVHVPDPSDSNALGVLQTVVRIDGRLSLFRNHALTDLRGLERLEIVGGPLSIRDDDSDGRFTSLEGTERLREVGELELEGNPALRSLAGLGALEVVHGDVHIVRNPSLPQSEIDTLLARVRVEGELVVADNGP